MLLNMFQVVKLLGLLPKTYSHQGPICSQISKNSLRINHTSMTIRACITLMYKSFGVTWKPNKWTWERIYWNPDTMKASWESQVRRKSLFYHCGWDRKNHASTSSFQYLIGASRSTWKAQYGHQPWKSRRESGILRKVLIASIYLCKDGKNQG